MSSAATSSDNGTIKRGLFIVFEGPEGAGKSTRIERLAEALRAQGRDVITTREPGGSELGRELRSLVLTPGKRVDPLAEFLLYAADRAQHVSEVIEPALAAGRDVISDRYTGASLAYQGHGRGLDLGFVADVNAHATGGLSADITFLLDIDPERGLLRVERRSANGRDRLESERLDFHDRVRAGYLRIAVADDTWLVIDAAAGEDEVFSVLAAALERLLHEARAGR